MVSPLLILPGPPTFGKRTKARKLANHFGRKTFSTGNAIRQSVRCVQDFGSRTAKAATKFGIRPKVDATGSIADVEARIREIGSQFVAAT